MIQNLDITGFSLSAARFTIFFTGLVIFLAGELKFPYRPGSVSKLHRWIINLSLAGINTILMGILFSSMIAGAGAAALEKKYGLLNLAEMPRLVQMTAVLLLMDFALYLWHVANHLVPVLWRFHGSIMRT